MARTAKKETPLTPEEKLAQALVPEEEQLYRVPTTWEWVPLSYLVKLYNGDRGVNYPSKKDYVESGIPFINAGAIQDGRLDASEFNYITQDKFDALRAGKIRLNDILYCLRGSLGKTAIVDFEDDGAISSSLCILRVNKSITVKYLYYLLNSDVIARQQDMAENGSAQPNLSAASVMEYNIPLAPLAEQQRIVDRIESLFAKLDEAKEKAQAVADGFEDRKAAILHKAFSGELTAEWREINGVNYSDTWEKRSLGDFASSQYGYTEKSSFEKIGPKFLRITDIQDEQVIWKEVPYCKIDAELKAKYSLNIGDIVVARTGATTGKSYMVVDEIDAVYASYLIRVSIERKELLKSKYLYYFLQCPSYWRQITELSSGIAQSGVNGNKLKTLQLQIPNVDEQEKIVEILDHLLPIERQAKDSAELVLDQIDGMKKSILARAFRGELGTNDPSDESAEELLKRIL